MELCPFKQPEEIAFYARRNVNFDFGGDSGGGSAPAPAPANQSSSTTSTTQISDSYNQTRYDTTTASDFGNTSLGSNAAILGDRAVQVGEGGTNIAGSLTNIHEESAFSASDFGNFSTGAGSTLAYGSILGAGAMSAGGSLQTNFGNITLDSNTGTTAGGTFNLMQYLPWIAVAVVAFFILKRK